jgi:GNAT superfamily N-acetyltransferase
MGASGISLREITDQNRQAVVALRVAASQEGYVSTVADSLEEARGTPEGNPWYRAIYADGEPVGFVMLSWNVTPDPPRVIGPWFLWKLLIDERQPGRGLGREVVGAIVDIVRREGGDELITSYGEGPGGPGGFYRGLGFVPTGDVDHDEIVARLPIS